MLGICNGFQVLVKAGLLPGGPAPGRATLTRNDLCYGDTEITVPTLTDPTPTQRRAFDLINQPIPLTLK